MQLSRASCTSRLHLKFLRANCQSKYQHSGGSLQSCTEKNIRFDCKLEPIVQHFIHAVYRERVSALYKTGDQRIALQVMTTSFLGPRLCTKNDNAEEKNHFLKISPSTRILFCLIAQSVCFFRFGLPSIKTCPMKTRGNFLKTHLFSF